LRDPGSGAAAFSVDSAGRPQGMDGVRGHRWVVDAAERAFYREAHSPCGRTQACIGDESFKLALDARFNLSIIRPTSGAVGTKNSLNINGLDVSGQAGGASIERSAAVKKVVDSRL